MQQRQTQQASQHQYQHQFQRIRRHPYQHPSQQSHLLEHLRHCRRLFQQHLRHLCRPRSRLLFRLVNQHQLRQHQNLVQSLHQTPHRHHRAIQPLYQHQNQRMFQFPSQRRSHHRFLPENQLIHQPQRQLRRRRPAQRSHLRVFQHRRQRHPTLRRSLLLVPLRYPNSTCDHSTTQNGAGHSQKPTLRVDIAMGMLSDCGRITVNFSWCCFLIPLYLT